MTSRLASSDLVGRLRELTEFETRLASVGQSSGATILVGGEAGVGKTPAHCRSVQTGEGVGLSTLWLGPWRPACRTFVVLDMTMSECE